MGTKDNNTKNEQSQVAEEKPINTTPDNGQRTQQQQPVPPPPPPPPTPIKAQTINENFALKKEEKSNEDDN